MFGILAIPIAAFAFWVWTWDKGIPYINQQPGQRWRAKARVAARNRTKILDQANVAWKAGQKSTAKTLSERGKHFGKQVERYNERAAKEIFDSLNAIYYSQPPEDALAKIDLHGLFVNEALVYTENHLERCREERITRTSIITGRGNNSKDGVAKIKPAVEGLLIREGLEGKFHWENEGCVLVELPLTSKRKRSLAQAQNTQNNSDGCVVM
ncbi:Smr domain-containing protein C11H11,03c [Ceratobasidium theobromae]|uniref:Smr domain-containing protein C11H11,03c n=1 Tax=Ceratobasidium theobromae TaxID=1582974 RepID=A0A5N5QFL3_9AGAM|nr:Smr domain-containing protein C11H11,03c [Ceratobasidium theobromae]